MNTTLQSRHQVDQAYEEVRACGLPAHDDRQKNWDALSTLKFILDRTNKNAAILEVGATHYSVMLPWLFLYGYRRLHGIDLVLDQPIRRGPILYEHGDLTATRFENDSFDAIVSLSVIEHGVRPEAYFREMSRLLRPGGMLMTSTDYWADPLDTKGMSMYGVPVKIFTRPQIETMLETSRNYDLWVTNEVDLDCHEKAVLWREFDLRFTFVCFAMEKRA